MAEIALDTPVSMLSSLTCIKSENGINRVAKDIDSSLTSNTLLPTILDQKEPVIKVLKNVSFAEKAVVHTLEEYNKKQLRKRPSAFLKQLIRLFRFNNKTGLIKANKSSNKIQYSPILKKSEVKSPFNEYCDTFNACESDNEDFADWFDEDTDFTCQNPKSYGLPSLAE